MKPYYDAGASSSNRKSLIVTAIVILGLGPGLGFAVAFEPLCEQVFQVCRLVLEDDDYDLYLFADACIRRFVTAVVSCNVGLWMRRFVLTCTFLTQHIFFRKLAGAPAIWQLRLSFISLPGSLNRSGCTYLVMLTFRGFRNIVSTVTNHRHPTP